MVNGTGKLPSGWAWARLGEVCDLIGGVTVDAKRTGADLVEVPYLRVANVQRGRICTRQMKTIRIPRNRADQLRLAKGDVLLNEGGDHDKVGRGWVWEGQIEDCIFQNHIFRARPRTPEVNPFYLSHYLNEIGRAFFLAGAKQTTNLASLSLSKVAEAPIMLAPAAEQARIVKKVEGLFADMDKAEAALARARAGLGEYRASLLHAACTGQLTAAWRASRPPPAEDGATLLRRILAERRAAWERAELARLHARGKPAPVGEGWKARYPEPVIPGLNGHSPLPNGWVWATVDQLTSVVQYGTSARCSVLENGVPVIRMGNLQNGRLDMRSLKHLPLNHGEFPALLLAIGDILFNRTNSAELVGKTAVYEGSNAPCSFASYLVRLRTVNVRPHYLANYINSPSGRAWVASSMTQQVGQANVSGGKLKGLVVPVPPIEEQDEILRVVDLYLLNPGRCWPVRVGFVG